MSSVEDQDLESYWKELRNQPERKIRLAGKATDFREGLEAARLKASYDIATKFAARAGQPVTVELLGEIIAHGIETFMTHWYEDLRKREPATLVEVVLEGQNLRPEELKAFVRALPNTLIERILEVGAMGSTGSGIHALLAVEAHFRANKGRDYELRRDMLDNKLIVTAYPARLAGEALTFKLDETFDLGKEAGVSTSDSG